MHSNRTTAVVALTLAGVALSAAGHAPTGYGYTIESVRADTAHAISIGDGYRLVGQTSSPASASLTMDITMTGTSFGALFVLTGSLTSANAMGVALPADVDGSGTVDTHDLLRVLASFGTCDDCTEDITRDHSVDADDLMLVLAH
ncbi:MAG: hypothetical protein KC983_07380 [Phycisphaerales bacterium]|nr:hypothetical protein [Phycisphaerales bacterium]